MFAVVLFFFGQQPQQYLVPNLVARWITLGNGYKFTVPHDVNVFALSGVLHCDLEGSSAKQIITECNPFICPVLLIPRGLFSIREGTDVRRRNHCPPRRRDRLISASWLETLD
jgi:hypothetical protein